MRTAILLLLIGCSSELPEPCADLCSTEEGVHCDPAGHDQIACYCDAQVPDHARQCELPPQPARDLNLVPRDYVIQRCGIAPSRSTNADGTVPCDSELQAWYRETVIWEKCVELAALEVVVQP